METNEPKDRSRSLGGVFPGNEDLIDGWPTAEPYFQGLDQAAESLSANDTRGIAQLGRRVGRFCRFNRTRLARLCEGLTDRSRLAFSCVPYLLHVNEKELPGFTPGRLVTHGVSQFEFNETIERAVRALFRKKTLRPPPVEFRSIIRSVFVVTDIGTMAQRVDDPISFYLVADVRGMGDAVRRQLLRRLEAISEWAALQGARIAFELIDPAWSRDGDFGNLRGENAMGVLLLERFYRQAIYISGEIPVFWCTTPGADLEKHRKTARLARRMDFDDALSFVDLGFVDLPAVRVRRRAMLGVLNHHPISPLSSILELILLLYGANASTALCEHMKSRIFRGSEAAHFVDPYVLLFDAACVALSHHGQWSVLSLLRRTFILKAAMAGMRTSRGRREFVSSMKKMTGYLSRWGWENDVLADAVRARRNTVADVEILDQDYRENILGLYRELTSMSAKSPGRFDEEEVALLGRRLVACFGRKDGQVPPRYSYLLHETPSVDHFFLVDDVNAKPNARWAVHTELVGRRPAPGAIPLYQADSLPSVLTWAAVNAVTRVGTDVRLVSSDSLVATGLLQKSLEQVTDAINFVDPLTLPSQRFGKTRRIERAILLVNFDQKRTDEEQMERDRRQYLPSNWDILNYGRERDSRVRDVAVITRDSWDQVQCRRSRGRDAVRVAMKHVFADRTAESLQDAPLTVLVPDGRTQRAVHDRLQQLMTAVEQTAMTQVKPKGFRAFVYEVGGQFQIIRRQSDGMQILNTRSMDGVVRLLSPSGLASQGVLYDALSPALADLRGLSKRLETDSVLEFAIGWRSSQGVAQLTVLDSTGRVYRRMVPAKAMDDSIVRIMRRIIHSIRHRVRDMRTLRKVLRVFELRDGETQGGQSYLYEDTVRLLRILGDPRPSHPEVFLRGDFSEGRDGIYFEYNGESFAPRTSGRKFVLELVARLIADKDKYSQFNLFIESSTVSFAEDASARHTQSMVNQLRLVDLYERLLARGLLVLRGKDSRVLNTENSFRRGVAL